MCKVKNFNATILSQNFRESNFFTWKFTLNWFDGKIFAWQWNSRFAQKKWENFITQIVIFQWKVNFGFSIPITLLHEIISLIYLLNYAMCFHEMFSYCVTFLHRIYRYVTYYDLFVKIDLTEKISYGIWRTNTDLRKMLKYSYEELIEPKIDLT